ncbi:Phosphoglycerate mutase family protein [Arabidopsis thaliana]|jgi:broad specificity phosphatase PhoE|uniref:Phosphoglycerate mutase family protein n=2 Tax=Arabidopsis thaliana TaxID=3702 RepID=F4JBU0_ARATH|nr:Phosphoglycerate mutase family protein [Arabidopsis thaliana]AEE80062.1 Phosphoglycerate mutase family protein [Arabidopsis thaliana]|eukprot:NP_191603.2 Phosphoglycerate mutase family protein [Arabidopsis thaliana]
MYTTITSNVVSKVTAAAATIRATMESAKSKNPDSYQNILMMRHGDRIDKIDPLWLDTAARPWDPPLVQDGMVRAFQTGQRIRSQIQFPIHRVFVSPFIRCIQTASEVIAALSAVDFDPNATSSKDVTSIDKYKLKVSIEFGLSEMLNSIAIKPEIAPKDGKFDFMISELEAIFPDGMVDHSVDPVYKEMPQWEETVEGCTDRFLSLIKTLADKYPSENLLLVTHGEGVRTTFATFKGVHVYDVEYCGCAELRRQVSSKDGSTKAGDFEVITSLSQCGIKYHSLSTTDQTSA